MSQTTTSEPDGAVKASVDPRQFKSFAEFYPFYLGEHRNATCRRLHFIGTSLSLALGSALIVGVLGLLASLVLLAVSMYGPIFSLG